jgi:hypothetical protein
MSHMSHVPVPAWSVGSFVVGITMFVRGFRTWREQRLIENTPQSRIRSMAMGLVEIDGTVQPRSSLSAPFSGHTCAFWQVDISTRNKNGWSIVHRNESGNPFFLSDETGVALVYPHGSECKLVPGVEEICNGPFLPPCYSEYIKANHLAMASVWSLGQVRFRERLIEPGQHVFVLGTAMPKSNAVSINDADEVQATGTDGRVNPIQTLDHDTKAIVRKGENETTFIISEQTEKTLALGMGIQAAAQLVGGPLLTLFGLGWGLFAWTAQRGLH